MASKKKYPKSTQWTHHPRRRLIHGLTRLEDRCTPSVAAHLDGTTLDINVSGGHDTAILSISGANAIVKDATNKVVFKTPVAGFDSIVAIGDGGASEAVRFKSVFNLNGNFPTTSITDVILQSSLTVNGDADATIDGSFSGSGKFTKNGAGILTLTGTSNVFHGAVTVGNGSLEVDSGSTTKFDAKTNVVEAAGLLDVFGTVKVGPKCDAALDIAGQVMVEPSATFNDNAVVRIEGGALTGGTFINLGTVNVNGSLVDNGFLESSSEIYLGTSTPLTAHLNIHGQMIVGDNGFLLNVFGSSLGISEAASLIDRGYILVGFLTPAPFSSASVDIAGKLVVTGVFEVRGSSIVESTGSICDGGSLIVDAQTLLDLLGHVDVTHAGSITVYGAVSVESGATLNDSGNITLSNCADSTGTVGPTSLDIAGNFNIGRHGSLETQGDVKVEASGQVDSRGAIIVDTDGFLDIFGTVHSEKPTGSLTVNGTETVEPGGHLYA